MKNMLYALFSMINNGTYSFKNRNNYSNRGENLPLKDSLLSLENNSDKTYDMPSPDSPMHSGDVNFILLILIAYMTWFDRIIRCLSWEIRTQGIKSRLTLTSSQSSFLHRYLAGKNIKFGDVS